MGGGPLQLNNIASSPFPTPAAGRGMENRTVCRGAGVVPVASKPPAPLRRLGLPPRRNTQKRPPKPKGSRAKGNGLGEAEAQVEAAKVGSAGVAGRRPAEGR